VATRTAINNYCVLVSTRPGVPGTSPTNYSFEANTYISRISFYLVRAWTKPTLIMALLLRIS
jgi:hypothetical protein